MQLIDKNIFIMRNIGIFVLGCFVILSHSVLLAQDDNSYQALSKEILQDTSDEVKLKLNELLVQQLQELLNEHTDKVIPLDSTALLFELVSKKKDLQIVTWGLELNGEYEYFGFVKSFNYSKKHFSVWRLKGTDFIESTIQKAVYNETNWPAGVYMKLIETSYNKRNYYTLLGWIAPQHQVAHKFIEVLSLSKSGKPSFGKSAYFEVHKKYQNRILFSYNAQSRLTLDYGKYSFSIKKWNSKKRKKEVVFYTDNLIVFDRLTPLYPDMKDHAEFMVPVGNSVDAFAFEKGKWRMKEDIDARNAKQKEKKMEAPKMKLFQDETH